MSLGIPVLLSTLVCAFSILNFLLQLICLTTSKWATFAARTDLDKPKEDGHFGLWSVCSTKAPRWLEDCDPLDTFFEVPPFSYVAGIFGILHLLLLMVLIPMSIVRTLQVLRSRKDFLMQSKIICIAKVVIAFLSAIFSILVAILASIGENRPEYTVTKGWGFWIQISVVVVNVIVTCLCAAENVRFWQQHIREHADPWGHRSETYGNPAFDNESPKLQDRDTENGSIAFTRASGHPYLSSANGHRDAGADPQFGILTFENPSFQENSPGSSRKKMED